MSGLRDFAYEIDHMTRVIMLLQHLPPDEEAINKFNRLTRINRDVFVMIVRFRTIKTKTRVNQ